jgi:hypothetical protein
LQAIDDFIRPKRTMTAEQDLKHLAPHRREPLGTFGTLRFGMGNGGTGAALVIVIGGRENCGHEGLK